MKTVTMYQTSDGAMHRDERAARAHCDELMGAILTRIAARLNHIHKYSDILAYLEQRLPELREAAHWQAESRQEVKDDDG